MNPQVRVQGPEKLGPIEYIVESRRPDASVTWLVVRADPGAIGRYAQLGLTVAPGARVVLEAETFQPIGILDGAADSPSRPAGFNPYFDPPLLA